MSIRKHTNELKVHEKTVGTAIKQDLSPDLNSLDYGILDVLEKKKNPKKPKCNFPSKYCFLKTSIEEEWNRMSEEFILRACKLFQMCVDIII